METNSSKKKVKDLFKLGGLKTVGDLEERKKEIEEQAASIEALGLAKEAETALKNLANRAKEILDAADKTASQAFFDNKKGEVEDIVNEAKTEIEAVLEETEENSVLRQKEEEMEKLSRGLEELKTISEARKKAREERKIKKNGTGKVEPKKGEEVLEQSEPVGTPAPAVPNEEENNPSEIEEKQKFEEELTKAALLIFEAQHASTTMIQRKLKLGYNRASRIMDQLEALGIIGPVQSGSKPREILVEDEEALKKLLDKNGIKIETPALESESVKPDESDVEKAELREKELMSLKEKTNKLMSESENTISELNSIEYPDGGDYKNLYESTLFTELSTEDQAVVNSTISVIKSYHARNITESKSIESIKSQAEAGIKTMTDVDFDEKKSTIESKHIQMEGDLEEMKNQLDFLKKQLLEIEVEAPEPAEPGDPEEISFEDVEKLQHRRKLAMERVVKLTREKIEAEETAIGTPLEEERRLEIFREYFLFEMEQFQQERIRESGIIGNALEKTQNWWDKRGNVTKAIISTTLVAGATALTANYLDIIPKDQILKRILTRVGVATAISTAVNMALAAGVPAKIAGMFKKENKGDSTEGEKQSLVKKLLNIKTLAIGLGAGVSWWFSGPVIALVALGGAGARELIDYLYNKVVEESKNKKQEISEKAIASLDLSPEGQDAFLEHLMTLSEEYDDIAQKLNNRKMFKGLANGATTMGAGLLTVGLQHQNMEDALKAKIEDKIAANEPATENTNAGSETTDSRAHTETEVVEKRPWWKFWGDNKTEAKGQYVEKESPEKTATGTKTGGSYKYTPGFMKDQETPDSNTAEQPKPVTQDTAKIVVEKPSSQPDSLSQDNGTKEAIAKAKAEAIAKAEEVKRQLAENETALKAHEEALDKAQKDLADAKGEAKDVDAKVAKGEVTKEDAEAIKGKVKEAEKVVSETKKVVEEAKTELKEVKAEVKEATEKVAKADIKVNEYAIVDGKKNVGITYAFRDQIRHDEELAKALKIDVDKLDDDKYMAKVTRDLAIKTGYMDEQGHEVRISKDGMGKIAYEMRVDEDGNVIVDEKTLDGNTIETHTEGTDSAKFEVKTDDGIESKGSENYEYSDGKEHHYKNGHEITDDDHSEKKIKKGGGPTIIDKTQEGPTIVNETGPEILTYDKYGYDQFGYDRNGFDRDGYNKLGFNKYGYDREGYDKYGVNKSGKTREDYEESIRNNEEIIRIQRRYEEYSDMVRGDESINEGKKNLIHEIFGRNRRDLENIKIWNKAGERNIAEFLEEDKSTKKEAILGTFIKTLRQNLDNQGLSPLKVPEADARISVESYLNHLIAKSYRSLGKEEAEKLIGSIAKAAKDKFK